MALGELLRCLNQAERREIEASRRRHSGIAESWCVVAVQENRRFGDDLSGTLIRVAQRRGTAGARLLPPQERLFSPLTCRTLQVQAVDKRWGLAATLGPAAGPDTWDSGQRATITNNPQAQKAAVLITWRQFQPERALLVITYNTNAVHQSGVP